MERKTSLKRFHRGYFKYKAAGGGIGCGTGSRGTYFLFRPAMLLLSRLDRPMRTGMCSCIISHCSPEGHIAEKKKKRWYEEQELHVLVQRTDISTGLMVQQQLLIKL